MPKVPYITACLMLMTVLTTASLAGESVDRAAALSLAIQDVLHDPQTPYHLEVDCTDDEAIRSLKVFRGEVAIWNRERQIMLEAVERKVLLTMLLDAGFSNFEARYGGRPKAEKEEAALRVSCRINLAVSELKKTSVQLYEGEQSAALLGLAAMLLDWIEPLAAGGVTATDIGDGLIKLADGKLAPETLELRLLRLPADVAVETGVILRILGGDISRQNYAPGRVVEPPDWSRITSCRLSRVVAALRDAGFRELPINLTGKGVAELEVGVLGHRKTVIARPRLNAAAQIPARDRFEQLVAELDRAGADCAGPE